MIKNRVLGGKGRDFWVFGLAVGAIAGMFGGAVTMLLHLGFKTDDVFAFFGALTGTLAGAIGTVLSAAWLSDRAINQEREQERRHVLEQVMIVVAQAQGAFMYSNFDPMRPDTFGPMREIFNSFKSADNNLSDAVLFAKKLRLDERQHIKDLQKSIRELIASSEKVVASEDPIVASDQGIMISGLKTIERQGSLTMIILGANPADPFAFLPR